MTFYREKQAELVFERFNVPSYYVCSNAKAALCAAGRKTGLVLESGTIGNMYYILSIGNVFISFFPFFVKQLIRMGDAPLAGVNLG